MTKDRSTADLFTGIALGLLVGTSAAGAPEVTVGGAIFCAIVATLSRPERVSGEEPDQ